jgi:phosphoglycerol geranylgeranyltransferase
MTMKSGSVYTTLNKSKPGVLVLLDPDRTPINTVARITQSVCKQGIDGILIGTSLLISPQFDAFVSAVKQSADKPVILFPGGSHQISSQADAVFFLSLLSGRNAQFLIGEQVKAVFLIREYHLEVIPVGYILVEPCNYTAVEYISNTKPIPRSKPEIAVAHALAGEYFGMKYIYLEAGSGAEKSVPVEMVKEVKQTISIPLIVGGGIRTAKDAQDIIQAGADYIVLGSIIEKSENQFKEIMRTIRGGAG